jgi:hypothetical protein
MSDINYNLNSLSNASLMISNIVYVITQINNNSFLNVIYNIIFFKIQYIII